MSDIESQVANYYNVVVMHLGMLLLSNFTFLPICDCPQATLMMKYFVCLKKYNEFV